MDTEEKTSSTPLVPGQAARTGRKPYLALTGFFAFLVLLAIPAYSVKKYADVLMKESPAKGQTGGGYASETQAFPADCGVVLTGAAGRVREGIALLSQGQIQKLIVSGVHQHSTLADMFPEILFYPEIKLENVILERRSNSTAGNAQSSLPIVEALGCQKVLLITHDYHMHRALKTFKQIFPGAVGIIPYPIVSDRLQFKRYTFFDSRFWGTVFEEWCKYLFYEVFVFSS